MARNLLSLPLPEIEPQAWISPRPLAETTVAIVTTAGLHPSGDRPFNPGSVEYRLVPGDIDFADLRMSHLSVNFDRSGFQQDINTVFPLERLRELAEAGVIRGREPLSLLVHGRAAGADAAGADGGGDWAAARRRPALTRLS